MPSGNEIGADELLWIPGGNTLGGFSEAIIEPIKVKKYEYIHNSNNYPMKREDEIIKSLNYTRCSKEYNIVKKSVFDGNLINIIVVKHLKLLGMRVKVILDEVALQYISYYRATNQRK